MKQLTLAVVTAALGVAAASGYAADSQPASYPTIVVAKSAEVKTPAKPQPQAPLKPHHYKPIHHARLGNKKEASGNLDARRLKPTAPTPSTPTPALTASVAK